MTLMPILNAIGRSYHAIADSVFENGAEKQKRIQTLRAEIKAVDALVHVQSLGKIHMLMLDFLALEKLEDVQSQSDLEDFLPEKDAC